MTFSFVLHIWKSYRFTLHHPPPFSQPCEGTAATDTAMRIAPPYIPWPWAAVIVSGVFELLGAAGILWRPTRHMAGLGLMALTVAVSPAHIYMLQQPELFGVPIWGAVAAAAGTGWAVVVDMVGCS